MLKGTVHPQIISLNYVMLIAVNKNFTVIITNYTRYDRYKEIIPITGCQIQRREGEKSSALTSPERGVHKVHINTS